MENNNKPLSKKADSNITVVILEYVPDSVVTKTVVKKSSGDIAVSSFASGGELEESISPFETYIQIIQGTAEVIIDGVSHTLGLGQSIIIPANTRHKLNANVQFKMIVTVLKNL